MSLAVERAEFERIITAIKGKGLGDREVALRVRQLPAGEEPQKPKPPAGKSPAENASFMAAIGAIKPAAALPAIATRIEYIDRPFLIWQPVDPSPASDQFLDYDLQPWSSWARWYVYAEGRSVHRHLDIYYLWTNTHTDYASVDADAPIILTGGVQATGSPFFFGGNETTAYSALRLSLMRWSGWGTDGTSGYSRDQTWYPVHQQSQGVIVANLSATGGWGFGGAQSKRQDFDAEQFNVGATGIGIPPGASMVFIITVEALMTTEGDTLSDQAWVDFGSDGNFLSSPSMKLTIRTLI